MSGGGGSAKVLLVGDSGVGKASILLRFIDDTFDEDINNTIGVDCKARPVDVDGQPVQLTIWDTAGQEKFRSLTSSYYRGAHAVVLVFDVCSRESFEHLADWLAEIELHCARDRVVLFLVANKVDRAAARAVPAAEGQEWARAHTMLFMECSAKTRLGIQQAFDEIAHKVMEHRTAAAAAQGAAADGSGARPVRLAPAHAAVADNADAGCC